MPLGGAAVFALGDLDEDFTDWAYERNPLFGSAHEANEASHMIRDLVRYEAIVLECIHLVVASDQSNAARLGPPIAGFSSAIVSGALVTTMKEWS